MSNTWDVRKFRETGHLPVAVSALDSRPFARQHGIRVLDLCLRMPDQGWAVPESLWQFREAIEAAVAHEETFAPLAYVYITADQKPVPAGGTQRRAGWHSDAYIVDESGRQLDVLPESAGYIPDGAPIERTYVAYDVLPTLFADGPWELADPADCDAVLRSFDEQVRYKQIVTYPPFTLLRLTPYDVHSVQRNETGEEIARTFIKIQFSTRRYNRLGNTLNPAFDYSGWEWVAREPTTRAHRYAQANPEQAIAIMEGLTK